MAATSAMDTTEAPQLIEHVTQNVMYTPYCVRWVPCSARFVALGLRPRGTGVMQVYQMKLGKLEKVLEVEKPKGFKCATFGASSLETRNIATGDYGGNLSIWDLERPSKAVFSVQAHKQIVNAMDGCGGLNIGGGAPEIVTCSRDGTVRVWDPRVQEPVLSMEPADGESSRDCWTVAFGNSYNDSERCVAAGYDNGDVKLFDLRTNTMRWETNVGNGVVGLEFDRKDIEMNKLVVCTLESKFRVYNMRTRHPEKGYSFLSEKAHKSTVWLGKHLPSNRDLFMTAGGNGGLNIYRYKYPSSLTTKDAEGKLEGCVGKVELLNSRVMSSQPFVSFDWSPDKEGLGVSACLDQTLRVYITTKLHLY